MGWKPNHKRIKPKEGLTTRLVQFHKWCYENHPCVCCGREAAVFHHLLKHPGERRREHTWGVPMNGFCHMDLHRAGSEQAHNPDVDWIGEAKRLWEAFNNGDD